MFKKTKGIKRTKKAAGKKKKRKTGKGKKKGTKKGGKVKPLLTKDNLEKQI